MGSRAEQDVQRSEIAREAQELEDNPAEELAELVVLYQREGRTYEEARHLADEIAELEGEAAIMNELESLKMRLGGKDPATDRK